MLAPALALGFMLLSTASAAAVVITCPAELMVHTVATAPPAGFTTFVFPRRATAHSTNLSPSGNPTAILCNYKVVQPLEAPPANPNFHIQHTIPANTTCTQRGTDGWDCLTAAERQPRPLPRPDLDRTPAKVAPR